MTSVAIFTPRLMITCAAIWLASPTICSVDRPLPVECVLPYDAIIMFLTHHAPSSHLPRTFPRPLPLLFVSHFVSAGSSAPGMKPFGRNGNQNTRKAKMQSKSIYGPFSHFSDWLIIFAIWGRFLGIQNN